jgi:thioesterase domain-containing protein/acyl carrier protein
MPPAGDCERQLLRIWESVLGIDGLGAEDDFWLVGGDSLALMTLLAEIEAGFGLRLPLSAVLDCPTVRQLAAHLEELQERLSLLFSASDAGKPEEPADECLVPIRADGGTTPIFVAHGMQCDPMFALMLGKHLPRSQPVYGFRGQGLSGSSKPLKTIESIAERYIESLLRIEPRGPYILSGFCAGGHVAMEMAHRLNHAGRQVAHLLLIDTPLTIDRASVDLEVRLARKTLKVGPRLRQLLAGSPATVAAFGEALQAYRPKAYSGRAHILASQDEAARMRDPRAGWLQYVSPATPLCIVARAHRHIAQEGMPGIVRYIREQLPCAPPSAEPARPATSALA